MVSMAVSYIIFEMVTVWSWVDFGLLLVYYCNFLRRMKVYLFHLWFEDRFQVEWYRESSLFWRGMEKMMG